jgi:hypothetical protein
MNPGSFRTWRQFLYGLKRITVQGFPKSAPPKRVLSRAPSGSIQETEPDSQASKNRDWKDISICSRSDSGSSFRLTRNVEPE